jgi:Iron-containing alcohol dehydrogenase
VNDWTAFVIFIVVIGGIGRMEGPLIGTIVFFLLREFFASLGPWYLMLLGAFAVVITLTMPKGIAGLLAQRFDLHLFPLRRRVHLPEQKNVDLTSSALADAPERPGKRAPPYFRCNCMINFTYEVLPGRVLFGVGVREQLSIEIERLGCARAIILSTPGQERQARELVGKIGKLAAGVFSGAVMHTPNAVSERAVALVRSLHADCTVALGGGSSVGLGKAIALRTELPQIAIPTTYAGSEMTPIIGETAEGHKTTKTDPESFAKSGVVRSRTNVCAAGQRKYRQWHQRGSPRRRGLVCKGA